MLGGHESEERRTDGRSRSDSGQRRWLLTVLYWLRCALAASPSNGLGSYITDSRLSMQ